MSRKLLIHGDNVKSHKRNNTYSTLYPCHMARRTPPRDSLIRNIDYLMRAEKLSEAALAKRSGIAQKTINNIRNGISAPTLDTIEALAAAFNLSGWHIIMPGLPEELIAGKSIERLCRAYVAASEKGRSYIDHVAEREATYGIQPPTDENIT